MTEEVSGIDLVREQLRVAAGEPLGYSQADIALAGHAIEARLYAETPRPVPACGGHPVRLRSGAGAVCSLGQRRRAGSAVGLDFDPMLAKVIAHAPPGPRQPDAWRWLWSVCTSAG